MKTVLKLISLVLLIAYLFAAFAYCSTLAREKKCNKIEIAVLDSTRLHYISDKDILKLIEKSNLSPAGKLLKDVNTERIEEILKKNDILSNVQCYKKVNGNIRIDVSQRIPVLRAITPDSTYYLDKQGKRITSNFMTLSYVPVATGEFNQEFAVNKLLPLALYLQNDKFWNSQIEQIYVNQSGEIELIPRIGDQLIILGDTENLETKLSNLMCLYKQAFSRIGWNTYDTISVQFDNQIVFTRRDKKPNNIIPKE